MTRFSKEKEQEIIKLYRAGKTQKEIAIFYNTFNTSIRRVLLRYNEKIRTGERALRFCKHNPFKRNDEYSDYFLGMLLTDGCVYQRKGAKYKRINLSLSERDKYMIEIFQNWVTPKIKISTNYKKEFNAFTCSYTFSNEEAVDWLLRKGNFYNKSYNCKIYTPINWTILRGIFDGDGGFHSSSRHLDFFICGKSLVFLQQIYNFLKKQGFTVYLKERYNGNKIKLYYVEIHKIQEVLQLGEFMYNNAHIFLKRKYEKWLAFYESRRAYSLNSGNEMAI